MTHILWKKTHRLPHPDEIIGRWQLDRFGEAIFPGISTAEPQYVDAGAGPEDGRSADEHANEGTLYFGTGGGKLDDKDAETGERKPGVCTATLIAKQLGKDKDPALKPLLDYILADDAPAEDAPADDDGERRQRRRTHSFELAQMLNTRMLRHRDNPQEVIDWAYAYLDDWYAEQREFFTVARDTYERDFKVDQIKGVITIRLGHIETTLESVSKVVRSKFAKHGPVDVFAQRNPETGHVQIFNYNPGRVNLDHVVRTLRAIELQMEGDLTIRNFHDLAQKGDGRKTGMRKWYYHVGTMVMCGGIRTPNAEPSKIPWRTILQLIHLSLNPLRFHPDFESDCQQGICANVACDRYALGLPHCEAARSRST